MCTALVVREEYWERQFEILKQLGIVKVDLNWKQIDVTRKVIILYSKDVLSGMKLIAEAWSKAIVDMGIIIRDTTEDILNVLSNLFKVCDIDEMDDFDTICDKLENRMLYMMRKESIKKEQYYKNQFKIAKIMNRNIMNHDRRC